jgi:phage gpG-like protein
VTFDELRRRIAAMARAAARPPAALLRQLSVWAGGEAKRCIAEGRDPDGAPYPPLKFPRARGGTRPLRDRGLLLASMTGGAGFIQQMGQWQFTQGSNLPYAALQNAGGVIVPTKGKFLAIPKTAEAAGVSPRQFPRKLIGLYGPRGGVLVERVGKGQTVAHYALVKRVVVPARRFIGFGAQAVARGAAIVQAFYARLWGNP